MDCLVLTQKRMINRIPSADGELSPEEKSGGEKPDYNALRVWGCKCYYFLPKKERTKLSPRAVPAVYLGPDSQANGHIIYVPSKKRVTSAYHVVFAEHEYLDSTYYQEDASSRPVTQLYREKRDIVQNEKAGT